MGGNPGDAGDEAVRRYLDGMDPGARALFERLRGLVTELCPDATLGLAYGMPVFRAGSSRLNVGAWKHGLSLYTSPTRDGGFSARHPGLASGKGTIRFKPRAADAIPDAEFRDLIRAALALPEERA